ncbi:alpha/beta-hydrolase [Gymnopilus junonius]|uniref:Alpha/beta-hydrolase n=1 Tax=Gymnopilus junonius TaxID=109634 RepID=A0A9P5NGK9_GYMJU|nr:alpha/beta-hydrolase [Gymnopilus junonius]
MTDKLIRSTTTRRGFVYSYYHNVPSTGKPTILFLHGFPSTHSDWASQISFFSGKGYGVIAPDLLGYGGTSAPDDVSHYRMLNMAEDIIDIFGDLGVDKVIGVAHDWGSILLSRLLNTHSDRFLGAAFLVLGYVAPQADIDNDVQHTVFDEPVDDIWGYFKFFAANDTPALIEKHASIDSFYSLVFPNDPLIWKTDLAPLDKAKQWIEQNKQLPRADFWTHEQKEEHKKALLKKGLRGPCNWYGAALAETNKADEALIAPEAHRVNVPTFYGAALKDYFCLAQVTKQTMGSLCSSVTTKDFETSHWVMLEASDELNDALEQFFDSL